MRCIGLIFASKLLNYCKVSDRLWLALEVKPYSGVFSWVSAGCCFFCLGLLAGMIYFGILGAPGQTGQQIWKWSLKPFEKGFDIHDSMRFCLSPCDSMWFKGSVETLALVMPISCYSLRLCRCQATPWMWFLCKVWPLGLNNVSVTLAFLGTLSEMTKKATFSNCKFALWCLC